MDWRSTSLDANATIRCDQVVVFVEEREGLEMTSS